MPLYLIEAQVLEQPRLLAADELAKELSERQHADWQNVAVNLQHKSTRVLVAGNIATLATAIARAVTKHGEPVIAEESNPSLEPATHEPADSNAGGDASELAQQLEATRAELADLKAQHERDRHYWQEKEKESERTVETALKEVDRERAEDAGRLQDLIREKQQLEEKLNASQAEAEQREAPQQARAITSRWPHRRPIAIAAGVALLAGAGGALGLTNLTGTHELGRLMAELERMREKQSMSDAIAHDQNARKQAELEAALTELAAAENTIEGLRQQVAAGPLEPGKSFQDCEFCPEMVVIPAGRFVMGPPKDEEGRHDDEGPQREVTIGSPFAIGKYEVTFNEYDSFAAVTDRDFPDDEGWGRELRPVINVSWDDARAYCSWLGEQTTRPYRLPSEAEWEYAARAGTMSSYAFGDDLSSEQANFDETIGETMKVGSYQPNDFGVFDMHGNVWEWTEDLYQPSYEGLPHNGAGRVVRGGGWVDDAGSVRSAYRGAHRPDARGSTLGFRCAGVEELPTEVWNG